MSTSAAASARARATASGSPTRSTVRVAPSPGSAASRSAPRPAAMISPAPRRRATGSRAVPPSRCPRARGWTDRVRARRAGSGRPTRTSRVHRGSEENRVTSDASGMLRRGSMSVLRPSTRGGCPGARSSPRDPSTRRPTPSIPGISGSSSVRGVVRSVRLRADPRMQAGRDHLDDLRVRIPGTGIRKPLVAGRVVELSDDGGIHGMSFS